MAETPEPVSTSHVRTCEPFKRIEAEARKVLRERGLTDEEIEKELSRARGGWDD
jgi:hypothetical protein